MSFRKGILLLMLLAVPLTWLFGMDTGELLQKMITAYGGKKNIAKHTTALFESESVLGADDKMKSLYILKAPNKMISVGDLNGRQYKMVYDGEQGGLYLPGKEKPQILSAPETNDLLYSTEFPGHAFLYPQRYGIKYKYLGPEQMGDKNFYKLERMRENQKITLYIHPETFFIEKSIRKLHTGKIETCHFLRHEMVDGLAVSTRYAIYLDGEIFQKENVINVKYDLKINDEEFEIK